MYEKAAQNVTAYVGGTAQFGNVSTAIPVRESEVQSQLATFENRLSNLHQAITALEDRCTLVTRKYPADKPPNGNQVAQVLVPLADRLRQLAGQVEAATDRLTLLSANIEL